jgi:hypothetical protein
LRLGDQAHEEHAASTLTRPEPGAKRRLVPKFRREHLAVDETLIDDDGGETPLKIVEPEDVSFGAESIACHFANGDAVLVRRSEIVNVGVNPYRSALMLVCGDGYSVSLPEHVDEKEVLRWYQRG